MPGKRLKPGTSMPQRLRIYKITWTRFGNYPDSPSPVLPLFDSRQECGPALLFSFSRKHCGGHFRLHAEQGQQRSVPERAASPGHGAEKGFGVLPQQAVIASTSSNGWMRASLFCAARDKSHSSGTKSCCAGTRRKLFISDAAIQRGRSIGLSKEIIQQASLFSSSTR